MKTRTVDPQHAVRESLETFEWLKMAGCEQLFFKYDSTFDSPPQGKLGPVADALADALNVDFVIACPALPESKRTL
ncbi:hypothetical protein AXG89_31385 (plasmid) [Burkholderia sp. PAMC 26561]|nr:hypothetical protein AXG89_31385 [Burkholderia sp. PAMC 26561]